MDAILGRCVAEGGDRGPRRGNKAEDLVEVGGGLGGLSNLVPRVGQHLHVWGQQRRGGLLWLW